MAKSAVVFLVVSPLRLIADDDWLGCRTFLWPPPSPTKAMASAFYGCRKGVCL